MALETILIFIPACFALNMAFGPNNLLSMTVGARYGMATAVMAASGRLVAFAGMIAIAALGLGALLMASEMMFSLIKWIGVLYLLWIGFKLIRSRADVTAPDISSGNGNILKTYLRQEFFVASGNPKAILIFTAFFPQFIQQDAYWQSFATLGTIFLLLEVMAITVYAFVGSRLSGLMRNARALKRVNRISGSMMMAFGVMLAFAGALPERNPGRILVQFKLHAGQVQPAAKLGAHFRKPAGNGETEAFVQADGGGVFRFDRGDQHMHIVAGGVVDERLHQPLADAVAARVLVDINRMFAGVAIAVEGAPVAIGSIAGNLAVKNRDDHRKAA